MVNLSSKENFLALVTDAYGGYGGIAQYNVDFLEALTGQPWVGEIEVLPRISEGGATNSPGAIRQFRAIHDKRLYALNALWRTLVFRPATIFCGHLYHSTLAVWLAKLSGARLISQVHGAEAWGPLRPQLLKALAQSDLILCVSEFTRAELLKTLSFPEDRIVVLPNRVGDLFVAHDHTSAQLRMGVSERPTVLSVGRLDDRGGYKGHDQVIRLMPGLQQKGLEFDYLIAGVGDDQRRLEQLVGELDLSDYVRFLGRVPATELPYLYAAADLFVLPSTGEGFGIVFVEAAACGTPVVGLAVGGSKEAIVTLGFGAATSADKFAQVFESELRKAVAMTETERQLLSETTIAKFGGDRFSLRMAELLHPVGARLP